MPRIRSVCAGQAPEPKDQGSGVNASKTTLRVCTFVLPQKYQKAASKLKQLSFSCFSFGENKLGRSPVNRVRPPSDRIFSAGFAGHSKPRNFFRRFNLMGTGINFVDYILCFVLTRCGMVKKLVFLGYFLWVESVCIKGYEQFCFGKKSEISYFVRNLTQIYEKFTREETKKQGSWIIR